MGSLAASLQPNTGILRNLSILEQHPVAPIDREALILHNVLSALQQGLVHITPVAGSEDEQVEVSKILSGAVADVTELKVKLAVGVVGGGDFTEREDLVLPVVRVRVVETLSVHLAVDLFDQFEANDRVVGGLVAADLGFAHVGAHGEELVDLVRIKDLVDTGEKEMLVLL